MEEVHTSIEQFQLAKTESKIRQRATSILKSVVHGINRFREVIDTLGN